MRDFRPTITQLSGKYYVVLISEYDPNDPDDCFWNTFNEIDLINAEIRYRDNQAPLTKALEELVFQELYDVIVNNPY